MRIEHRWTTAISALALLSGCAALGMGNGASRFSTWDRDGDRTIGPDEFLRSYARSEMWSRHDDDENGFLSRDEFADFVMEQWDTDDDGDITAPEFARGTQTWDLTGLSQFEQVSTDDDARVGEEEFGRFIDGSRLYDRWDRDGDGFVSADELGESLFAIRDENEDGRLQPAEFLPT